MRNPASCCHPSRLSVGARMFITPRGHAGNTLYYTESKEWFNRLILVSYRVSCTLCRTLRIAPICDVVARRYLLLWQTATLSCATMPVSGPGTPTDSARSPGLYPVMPIQEFQDFSILHIDIEGLTRPRRFIRELKRTGPLLLL
jgi:hypothetical protein